MGWERDGTDLSTKRGSRSGRGTFKGGFCRPVPGDGGCVACVCVLFCYKINILIELRPHPPDPDATGPSLDQEVRHQDGPGGASCPW